MKTSENETSRDPFLCTCGPCKRFWRSTFGPEAGRLKRSPVCKTKSLTSQTEKNPYLPVGGRVTVNDKHSGTVQYVGYLERKHPKLYVGVKLDDNVNSAHNGIHNGKRYFYCPKGHGAMVEYDKVRPVSAPNKRPSLTGNYMFPSYGLIRQRRRERNEQLSALETSSNNSSPRSASLPALNGGRSGSATRRTNDPLDIVYQDRIRQLEKEKRLQEQKEREARKPRRREPTPLQKWTKEFGGDERAARMAETLQKLHLAYEEGLKLVDEESQFH